MLTTFYSFFNRWGSTYLMVERILAMKPQIKRAAAAGNVKLQLYEHQWQEAEQLRSLLKDSYTLTKKMQMEDLTAGYFYK